MGIWEIICIMLLGYNLRKADNPYTKKMDEEYNNGVYKEIFVLWILGYIIVIGFFWTLTI